MGKRKSMPTKAQIADYWKDKKLPNGLPVVVDWYEPSCWACGMWVHNPREGEFIKQGKFNEIWNDSIYKLERCHIHPKALGGSNDEDNLFLMCSICHEDSPDTTNRDLFLNWVANRTLDDALKNSVIYKINEQLIGLDISLEEFNDFYSDKSRFKLAEERMNSHGFKIVKSTLVAGYLDYFLENREVI